MQLFPLRAGLAVLALATLAACDDSGTAPPADAGNELARQVEALGFRGDMVQDFGSHIVVEGDIRIEKSQLPSVSSSRPDTPLRPLFQYRTTALVGSPKVHLIQVDLSSLGAHPNWLNAAREAMGHWNALPHSYVRLQEGGSPDIIVTATCNLGSGTAGLASWPSAGNPGPTIQVNPCFSSTQSARVRTMVHEFGHTLGLRHTNWSSLGESAGSVGAVHIPGTTTGKNNGSVMNGGTAGDPWGGFTWDDHIAVQQIYPIPVPTVTVSYSSSGEPIITWTPVFGAASYTVRRRRWIYGVDEFGHYNATSEIGAFTNASSPFVDTGSNYTGVSQCEYDNGPNDYQHVSYGYTVEAVFTNGYGDGHASAETAVC
jgi:hypothetical protein